MLSKKMTISLMSLITIFAFAFAVPTVMAAFDVTITADDVMEGGGIEIEYSSEAQIIKVSFAEVIENATFGAVDIVITPILRDGGTAAALTVGTIATGTPNNGKDFEVPLSTAIAFTADSADPNRPSATTPVKLHVMVKKDAVNKLGDPDNKNKVKIETINLVREEPGTDGATVDPEVVSITRAVPISHPGGATFVEEVVTGSFQVKIVLTEKPNGGLADGDAAKRKGALDVAEGTVTEVVAGIPFARVGTGSDTTSPPISEGGYTGTAPNDIPNPSGRDRMYYTYLATIVPKGTADMITIKVKDFKDTVKARGDGSTGNPRVEAGMYTTPPDSILDTQPNGRERLKVKTTKTPAAPKTSGTTIYVHHREGNMIPANGFNLVLYDGDKNGSSIAFSHEKDDENKADKQAPAQLLFNTRPSNGQMPNLETFLANGGTIDLMGPDGTAKGSVIISEIMWGSDASLDPDSAKSQWLELQNMTSSAISIGEKKWSLVFYSPADTLPTTGYVDRVGTVGVGGYWSIGGKGQSGRSHIEEGDPTAILGHIPIISMQRVIDAAGMAADGTMASSWAASVPPALNFKSNIEGVHVATPGAAPITYPAPPAPTPEPAPAPVVPVADAMDIMITEIMVDTGNGRLPQWIELNNVSGAAVSLAGWSVMIENDSADADVIGSDIEIQLSGTLGVSAHEGNMGQGNSLLLVSRAARSSSNLDGNKNIVDVSGAVQARGHYKLISDTAFMITLVPPQKTGVFTPGDMAGNLDASPAWEIPMGEDGRSSLIRHEMDAGMMTKGTDANGWVLASSTSLVSGPATWYGSDEDAGTPGYDAGGPLPVELSHFRPARDKATGAVVITWATQSELNNAGFFIKRSQQRDGEFKVINATMIAGAGTTSEKQFYTYTDTTAQPNIVYYYQIEDVSLDGNRQTLTRGIRLKGHIGAAGKLTSTWGELKSSNE